MEDGDEVRALPLTPTWSVAIVLTVFVAISLLVERSIHHLSSWLQRTNRKPLLESLEKMKEELMLLGFMSLLLTATSNTISSICIHKKFYGTFSPCSRSEANKTEKSLQDRNLVTTSVLHNSLRRGLIGSDHASCQKGYEPFVSYEGLEQLHRFIFIMAVTHIFYSCLTMLLAVIKIHSWRKWEDEAYRDMHDAFSENSRESSLRRHSTFVKFHLANPWGRNKFIVWMTCFFRQFGNSVNRSDYLTLRMGFITNHNLMLKYDFHSYMIRSMEEEFPGIVGVSAPLWGFVVAFMLFNVNGTNLYFWMAVIPTALLLVLGTKLQQIIAALKWENAGVTGFFAGTKLTPRDDLFWFNKPRLILSLLHFVLFQNAFEMASFFWFWWEFGYHSCFIKNQLFVYTRLVFGFAGQFLCSYSTLPLYALVTQMGTNYKAALIPQTVRETIHGWNKATKKRRRRGLLNDDVNTDTSTVYSFEDDDRSMYGSPKIVTQAEIELNPISTIAISPRVIPNESSSRAGTPLLRNSASISSPTYFGTQDEGQQKSPSKSPPMAIQRRGSN